MTDQSHNQPAGESAPPPDRTTRSEVLTNILVLVVAGVLATVFWDFFRTPVMFVVTLGILVAVHEWGHFIASKSVGVHVYEFALGFGPKLITYMRRGGTEYTIRAIPLGGFVNPKGMQPDDPITPDGLNGRRPAERALVYLAGPLMNIILAVLVFCLTGFLVGSYDESVAYVGVVNKGSEASKMQVVSVNGQPASGMRPGMREGDRILEVNGQPVGAETVVNQIHPNANKPVTMKVQRGKDTLELRGTPKRGKVQGKLLVISEVPAGVTGVQAGDQLATVNGESPDSLEDARDLLQQTTGKPTTLGIWRGGEQFLQVQTTGQALPVELRESERWVGQLGFQPSPGMGPRIPLEKSVTNGLNGLRNYFAMMGSLFSRPKQLGDNVGGPVRIFSIMGPLDRLPPIYYFGILGQLSLSLAVFNLLPVPMLDGGHMLLVTVEVLRRRRLEPETQRAVAMVGLALIGVLFVYIMWKDIMNLL